MSKLFTNKEIEEFFEDIKYVQTFDCDDEPTWDEGKLHWAREGFKKGIKFSENKTMRLLLEFAKYIEESVGGFNFVDLRNNPPTDMSNEDLIKMFLKDRNNENN